MDRNQQVGRFVLTGSQQFGMVAKLTQSLAGRIGLLTLLPFSYQEIGQIETPTKTLDEHLFYGSYPAIYDRHIRPSRWYADYITTYIQRDVRQVSQIQNLETFTLFLRLCAGNIGQVVNTNKWGAACGVDHKTIKHWLSVLQASYIIRLLQPYHVNFKKRLIKSPKLYFYDTGLACRLLGIDRADILKTHSQRGSLVENWVFSELVKSSLNRGEEPQLYFWRTQSGEEIDFIATHGMQIVLVEVKSGQSLHHDWGNTMNVWQKRSGLENVSSYILYGGHGKHPLKTCLCLGWQSVSLLSE